MGKISDSEADLKSNRKPDLKPDFIHKKENCCGCTACESICPMHAIRMKPDAEGFLYPVVDKETCISCGLCQAVCPILNRNDTLSCKESEDTISHKENSPEKYNAHSCSFSAETDESPCSQKRVVKNEDNKVHIQDYAVKYKNNKACARKYAVKHKNSKVRMGSTSGAAYTALSDAVLDSGGVVYCTVFDEKWEVRYVRITGKAQRDQSRGAKYVQSRLDHTYTLIETDLAEGTLVLFVGPPCYVDGLRKYLHHSASQKEGKLLTVDMVCHGVPSPLLWQEQVSFLKTKYPSLWTKYSFRDKRFGWRGAHNTISFENGTVLSGTREMDAFTSLYFAGLISRPICHICKYTDMNRPGDLTIGDCWGIEECHENFDDGMGVSLVIVNTDAGATLWEQVKAHLDIIPLEEQECVQPQLQKPAARSEARDAFWRLYTKRGYEVCIKKFTTYGKGKRLRSSIRQKLIQISRIRERS